MTRILRYLSHVKLAAVNTSCLIALGLATSTTCLSGCGEPSQKVVIPEQPKPPPPPDARMSHHGEE